MTDKCSSKVAVVSSVSFHRLTTGGQNNANDRQLNQIWVLLMQICLHKLETAYSQTTIGFFLLFSVLTLYSSMSRCVAEFVSVSFPTSEDQTVIKNACLVKTLQWSQLLEGLRLMLIQRKVLQAWTSIRVHRYISHNDEWLTTKWTNSRRHIIIVHSSTVFRQLWLCAVE